jgi:hypothetical protein
MRWRGAVLAMVALIVASHIAGAKELNSEAQGCKGSTTLGSRKSYRGGTYATYALSTEA